MDEIIVIQGSVSRIKKSQKAVCLSTGDILFDYEVTILVMGNKVRLDVPEDVAQVLGALIGENVEVVVRGCHE